MSSGPEAKLRNDLRVELRDSFSHKICLVPASMKINCAGPIVAAHSLQRNGLGLNTIAEMGHVLRPRPNWQGSAQMEKIGIGKASTFTGFCGFHDPRIFAPLETAPLIPTDEQIFLQTYRALCQELFKKIASNDHARKLRDRDLPGRRHAEGFSAGVTVGLRELRTYKETFDDLLVSRDLHRLRYVAYHFECSPSVLCTAWLSINFGFQGQILQQISDLATPLQGTVFSILPTKNGVLALFSWIDDSPFATRLKNSLAKIQAADAPEYILHFAYEYAEDVFCRPSWWDGLTSTQQDSISRHFLSGASSRAPRSRTWLVLRPRIELDWRLVNVTSNA